MFVPTFGIDPILNQGFYHGIFMGVDDPPHRIQPVSLTGRPSMMTPHHCGDGMNAGLRRRGCSSFRSGALKGHKRGTKGALLCEHVEHVELHHTWDSLNIFGLPPKHT